MSIIAIFSGIYCSAGEIARQVAERLDYTLVSEELLQDAAARFGASEQTLARSLTGTRGLLNIITHDYEKGLIYIKAALAERLAADDLVYHGAATHLIPPAIAHVLRVGIIAEQDYRLEQAAERDGLEPTEAAERIRESDEALARWTEEVRSCGPWDPSLYDIKIPLPATSVAAAVDLICAGLQKDALRPTNRSVQAALDFRLSTRVNAAIVEHGYYFCDVIAEDGDVEVVINKKLDSKGKLGRTVAALRLESMEEELLQLCRRIEGVSKVKARPGAGYKRAPRALLVDDETEYVLTLSERLQMRDIEADVVHDGAGALSRVEAEEPDVMVLDLRMPGLDGMEVLRRVKREHPRIEVIIVTGHGTEKDEQMAEELGAFAYLKKPVNIDILAKTMKDAQRRVRAGREGEGEGAEEDAHE